MMQNWDETVMYEAGQPPQSQPCRRRSWIPRAPMFRFSRLLELLSILSAIFRGAYPIIMQLRTPIKSPDLKKARNDGKAEHAAVHVPGVSTTFLSRMLMGYGAYKPILSGWV